MDCGSIGLIATVSVVCGAGTVHAGPVIRIMPLGDSITAGSDGGYRTVLFNTLNEAGFSIDFVGSTSLQKDRPFLADPNHEGHGGWRINTIERNITQWMADHDPDVIMLHIGTNDISSGQFAGGVAVELSGLLGTIYAAKPDVTVYVASIILRTDRDDLAEVTREYAELTPEVVLHWAALGYDARLVDMHSEIGPEDLADGVHPNATGYDKMGRVWAAAFEGVPADMLLAMDTPRAGQSCSLRVKNSNPMSEVRLFGTTGFFGSTLIDDFGVSLDINAPMLLGSATADADGVAVLSGIVPADRAGDTIRVQAASPGVLSQVLVKIVRH